MNGKGKASEGGKGAIALEEAKAEEAKDVSYVEHHEGFDVRLFGYKTYTTPSKTHQHDT
jgi:hypothetical protein